MHEDPHATGGVRARFTTHAPSLADEQVKDSALFHAHEELLTRVAAWSSRLFVQYVADNGSAGGCPKAPTSKPSQTSSTNNQVELVTFHGINATPFDSVPPTASRQSPSKKQSPHRRYTQTAGEEIRPRRADFFQDASVPIAPLRSVQRSPIPAITPATSVAPVPSSPSVLAAAAFVESPSSLPSARRDETDDNVTMKDRPTITLSASFLARTPTTPPPWLREELDAFFQDHLATAIQARETELVNVIHGCVQQDLQERQQHALRERQRTVDLATQAEEQEKWVHHLQSKLDRRIDENNALRKDYYKQLLMLRELVAKHRSDPRTMKALDEVIAAVNTGKYDPSSAMSTGRSAPWVDKSKSTAKGTEATTTSASASSMGMRREKEKWEQRAREAVAECEQLQEQLLLCKQQLEEARRLDGDLWFASVQHGLFERQRIIDCVYKSKCTWDDVGESIIELLNNDMIWEAVEESALKDKSRVSRGLEALLLRAESTRSGVSSGGDDGSMDQLEAAMEPHDGAKRTAARRRSAFSQASRLIMCRTCNGCGYLDATEAGNSVQTTKDNDEPEDDSYLRKTLAQVLELKASLEEANSRTSQVEQQLLRTVMEGAQTKEKLDKIEFARSHSIDCGLQVDLDDEEEISLDDIMNAHNEGDSSDSASGRAKRGGRWKQYEHLIVELKSLLTERDAGIADMKATVADSQTRLVTVQRTAQQEQERLQRELQTLKGSLALAMSSRNDVIEEKQAAVKLMLKTMERKKTQAAVPSMKFLVPPTDKLGANGENDNEAKSNGSDSDGTDDGDEVDDLGEFDDVQRAEKMARRYSDAISRVQQEHEEQQLRLKHAEEELGNEADKRKRTNSVTMGNVVVTMSSHPRDIFKALTTTHQDLLTLRRSSQRASALQTDRLLTLTTHLAHISEELAMVKKRTCAEVDFWKLDCEKLQNANKALAADLETAHKHLEEANERVSQAIANGNTMKVCAMCDKHEARLLGISNQLLGERRPSNDGSTTASRSAAELSESERNGLCAILMDLESMYATLNAGKQQQARAAITKALLGSDGGRSRESFAVVSRGSDLVLPADSEDASRPRGDPNSQSGVFRDEPSRLFALTPGAESTAGVSRPFQASLFDEYSFNQHVSGGLLLHGIAIDTNRLVTADTSPSHRRKTVVRKVLTDQQVALRKSARRSRGYSRKEPTVPEGQTSQTQLLHLDAIDGNEYDDDSDGISSYIDENGTEVFYEDVEVEENPGRASVSVYQESARLHALRSPEDVSRMSLSNHRVVSDTAQRPEHTVEIPLPASPSRVGYSGSSVLLASSSDIDKDPEVITKLKELVTHTSTARELLALANWKIFVCHLRAWRDQRRLDYVNGQYRDRLSSGKAKFTESAGSPSRPLAIRTTMQKLVQFRELELDSAVRYRDSLRRESRRAQAHLIHGVSTVLTSLSRKNKAPLTANDPTQLVHLDPDTIAARLQSSPTHSPQRPLYPSVKVNLSDVPETQQIPTPSFPFTRPAQPVGSYIETSPSRPSSPGTQPGGSGRKRMTPMPDYLDTPSVSIFENDNKFPQRVVRFIPAGDGDDLSLTHATSSIRFPTTSPSTSPTKSPSRAGLVLDLRRRPTHSAGYVRLTDPESDGSTSCLEFVSHQGNTSTDPIRNPVLALTRRPTRPQSSPAGSSSRARNLPTAPLTEVPPDVKLSELSSTTTVRR